MSSIIISVIRWFEAMLQCVHSQSTSSSLLFLHYWEWEFGGDIRENGSVQSSKGLSLSRNIDKSSKNLSESTVSELWENLEKSSLYSNQTNTESGKRKVDNVSVGAGSKEKICKGLAMQWRRTPR
jgi:hypothetical protein